MVGLSNKEAHEILLTTLRETVNDKINTWSWSGLLFRKRSIGDLIRLFLLLVAAGLLLAAFIFPFFVSNLRVEWRLLAESLILIVALLCSFLIFIREQRTIKLGMVQRFQEHLYQFTNRENPFQNEYLNSVPQCAHNVLRNGQWISLSTNLLVTGDVILLQSERAVPCRVRVSKTKQILERGEIFEEQGANISDHEKIFITVPQAQKGYKIKGFTGVLEETPAAIQLQEALDFQEKKEQIVEDPLTGELLSMTLAMSRWKIRVYKTCLIILIFSLILCTIINIVKYILQRDQLEWTELLFVRQAYLCIPLLFLTGRWMVHLLHSIANAVVYTIFHKLQRGDNRFTETQKEGQFFDDDEDEQTIRATKAVNSSPSMSSSVQRPSLIELLGSITVVCVIDRQGILSDNVNYIEKLCFFDSTKLTILELSRDQKFLPLDENELGSSNENSACKYTLQFNDPDWENYLPSLKPLGLNCLLNSFCQFGAYNSTFDRYSIGVVHSDNQIEAFSSSCNCLLGLRIGFSEGALDSFYPMKHIYRIGDCTTFLHSLAAEGSLDHEKENQLKERASKYGYRYFPRQNDNDLSDNIAGYSVSTAVQDINNGSLQLLSKGSPALILASTLQAWDGAGLHTISTEDYTKILDLEKQWAGYRCIAFSYQPIPEQYHHLLSDVEIPAVGKQSNISLRRKSTDTSRASFDSFSNLTTSADIRDSLSKGAFGEETDEIKQWREVMEFEPIFIGMIAMRQLPKFDVENFIIGLKASGTRFVHFSLENRRATKAFSERLGLETDWNCAIDLRDSDDKVENAPSGLPKGVSNIRGHLDQIDDVPLLIPTFYNASEDSIAETVRIFQEKGDVVCVIGNAVKFANSKIFLQSDVSIGWQPQEVSCLNPQECREKEEIQLSSANFLSHFSTGSFSVDLNCLSCELIMHKDSSFDSITALIQTSRHFLINFKQALGFYLSCLILLHFVLVLDYISFLPTIFNGVQIFWLLFFVIPILCSSLMFSHKSADTMRDMNTKRYQFIKENFNRGLISRTIVAVPVAILIVLFFAAAVLLAWYPNSSMKGLFGFENSSILKSSSYISALIVAQNTTLTCFVICITAWSFAFLQQHDSLFKNRRRYLNSKWIISVIIVLIGQIIFMLAMINVDFLQFVVWNLFLLVPSIGIALIIVVLEFYFKYRYRKWHRKEQQFMSLEFNTKLGMYSPVSPF